MNIFFLDFNAAIAAKYHCDKHVVKMILETAQLLYTAHRMLGTIDLPDNAYKLAHKNHPCAIWARESLENYTWLCQLGLSLCKEYRHRYNNRTHKTEQHLVWLSEHPPPEIPVKGVTTIRLAMPDEYKRPNPVEAYRTYYIMAKRRLLSYTRRDVPEFLKTCIK